jgi:hypothetical protein
VLEKAWPAFLAGAGIDLAEPHLSERVHALQALCMLEQLAHRQPRIRHRRHPHRPLHAALA